MNIAHIYPAVMRMHGATKWLMLFTTSLSRIGHQNTIYCPLFCLRVPEWFQGEIKPLKRQTSSSELSGVLKLASIFVQIIFITFLPFKISRKTDVIVLHSEPSLFALPLCKLLFRQKKVVYYCYQPPRELYDLKEVSAKTYGSWFTLLSPLFFVYKWVDKLLVRAADCVLVWSDYSQSFVKSIYGDVCLYNVPAGVDFGVFERGEKINRALDGKRKELDVSDKKILLMNSALLLKKRIPVFFNVVYKLREKGYPVFGIIIGEGPEKEKLELELHALKIAKDIKLLGYVSQEDLPVYCHMADIFYYLEENGIWTMSTVEAGAVKKPVVVSQGGAMDILVTDGETGFVVGGDDFENDIVEKTEYLLNNPEICRKFGVNNYNHSKQFSAESSAKTFEKIVQ